MQAEKLTAHQAPPAQDAWEDMRLPHPGALGLESTRLKLQPVPVAFPFPETFATGGAPGREQPSRLGQVGKLRLRLVLRGLPPRQLPAGPGQF